MFTVEQRDALRERVLRLAQEDDRVVAAAVVGSLAKDGGGDRFSDLDLTFGIADRVPVSRVLDDWTTRLAEELGAVTLADLERGLTTYRVFLLPGALQLDLSMTPAAQFRPYGPRLRLVFGQAAAEEPGAGRPPASLFIDTPAVARDIFGLGAVRDHALSLACLRHGVVAVQARGYDELPAEILAQFNRTLVGAAEPRTLRAALAAAVTALLHEGAQVPVPAAETVAERLAELC
jgi:predicted nucleotidyltransferase